MTQNRKIITAAFMALAAMGIIGIAQKDSSETGAKTLPERLEADMATQFTFKEALEFEGNFSEPVQRIINADNTCAGVVRADGSADGECPPESANLPTVPYDVAMPPKNARE